MGVHFVCAELWGQYPKKVHLYVKKGKNTIKNSLKPPHKYEKAQQYWTFHCIKD